MLCLWCEAKVEPSPPQRKLPVCEPSAPFSSWTPPVSEQCSAANRRSCTSGLESSDPPSNSSSPCKWKTLCALNPARACVPDFTTVLLPRVAHLPKTHSPLGRGTPPKAPVCTDSQLPCHAANPAKTESDLGWKNVRKWKMKMKWKTMIIMLLDFLSGF